MSHWSVPDRYVFVQLSFAWTHARRADVNTWHTHTQTHTRACRRPSRCLWHRMKLLSRGWLTGLHPPATSPDNNWRQQAAATLLLASSFSWCLFPSCSILKRGERDGRKSIQRAAPSSEMLEVKLCRNPLMVPSVRFWRVGNCGWTQYLQFVLKVLEFLDHVGMVSIPFAIKKKMRPSESFAY